MKKTLRFTLASITSRFTSAQANEAKFAVPLKQTGWRAQLRKGMQFIEGNLKRVALNPFTWIVGAQVVQTVAAENAFGKQLEPLTKAACVVGDGIGSTVVIGAAFVLFVWGAFKQMTQQRGGGALMITAVVGGVLIPNSQSILNTLVNNAITCEGT